MQIAGSSVDRLPKFQTYTWNTYLDYLLVNVLLNCEKYCFIAQDETE